jgi:zinc and cadmium transporter
VPQQSSEDPVIMPATAWLLAYCLIVLLGSTLGGYVPLIGRVTHSRLQMYLSLSAGIMLGASFFHVMPEAMEAAGPYFGWWMTLGVVGLFCIERFIAPHSHELANGHGHHHHGHHHHHEHLSSKHEEVFGHGHEHAEAEHHHHDHGHGPQEHRAAAPSVAGWMAVVGLTIHTFGNGVGLAGAVRDATGDLSQALAWWPGWAMFLAIIAHKPADALAISTVLSRKGVSRAKILLVQLGFATMVPVGVIFFFLLSNAIDPSWQKQLTGAALSFSAGTFLFISLSDLLPEVQFHKHDRIPLFMALLFGVVLMGLIANLEGHDHGDEGHHHGEAGQTHDEGAEHGHHHDH